MDEISYPFLAFQVDNVKILLVNPPVYDFKLYNEWMNPTGLMQISSLLKRNGFETEIFDTLYSLSELKKYSTGFFTRETAAFPNTDYTISNQYYRYGMAGQNIETALAAKKYDAVFIGSFLTYWYPGCFEIIQTVKKLKPEIPVFLGGIYATLCREHALKYSGADFVFSGIFNDNTLKTVAQILNFRLPEKIKTENIASDVSSLTKTYFSLSLTTGCPYQCSFCASSLLSPVASVNVFPDFEIFLLGYQNGIKDFAFFDDALLYYLDDLEKIIFELEKRGIFFRFHAPNGLHINRIKENSAHFLFQHGFKTLRFGLEIFDKSIQQKADKDMVIRGVENLKKAGFSKKEIGFYVLLLPGVENKKVENTIDFLKQLDVNIHINVYSPVPGTQDYRKLSHKYPEIIEEPLLHNDSVFYRKYQIFPESWVRDLKREIRRYNSLDETAASLF